MGFLVSVALATLAGVSCRTNTPSGEAADMWELRANQVATLDKFKQALLTINLAAMDAIVDKDQSVVSSDVMGEIRYSATYLCNSLSVLSDLADTADEQI